MPRQPPPLPHVPFGGGRMEKDAAGFPQGPTNPGISRYLASRLPYGKSISLKQLSAELTALKQQPETAWLGEVDSQALQQALKDLHQAFVNFFKKRAKHPRFKS